MEIPYGLVEHMTQTLAIHEPHEFWALSAQDVTALATIALESAYIPGTAEAARYRDLLVARLAWCAMRDEIADRMREAADGLDAAAPPTGPTREPMRRAAIAYRKTARHVESLESTREELETLRPHARRAVLATTA